MDQSNASNVKADRLLPGSLLVGAIGLAVSVAFWVVWPEAFFRGYLTGYLFCLGIPLGCLAIEMIYRLTGGGWGEMLHRSLMAAIQTLPLAALLFLPVFAGMESLYPWAKPSAVQSDHALAEKDRYLNADAFTARAIAYFVIWTALGFLLTRWSLRLDRTGDAALVRRLGILSGPGAVLFALIDTFAAVDWQMSLEPHWYSTIFPVIFGISQVLAGLAFATLAATVLAPHPRVVGPVGKLFLQDLGSLLLSFIVLWAYVSFSQFLLIWAGNLPEERQWYAPRSAGGWQMIAGFLALCQFATPFLFLLSKRIKRSYRALGGVAAFVLLMHFVDVYWQVIPAFSPGALGAAWRETAAAIAAALGIGGVLFAVFLHRVRSLPERPLIEPTSPPEETHG